VQGDVEMPTSGQAHPAAYKLSASQSDVDLWYLKHAMYHRINGKRRATCFSGMHGGRDIYNP
jgi:hypothetical protein